MAMSTRLYRIALVAVLVAVLGIWLDASGTLSSGWNTATVANSNDTAQTPTLALTHQYPDHTTATTTNCSSVSTTMFVSTQTCGGTPLPATASTSQLDTITNNGTTPAGATTATVGVPTCAPRQLANTTGTADAFIPRYSTQLNWTSSSGGTSTSTSPFSGAGGGSVRFSGGSGTTGDYASTARTVTAVPGAGFLTQIGAYGLWFKTTATSGGLVSYDSVAQVPSAATTKNTLALYLTSGKVGVRVAASSATTTASTYSNGSWHYAYVTVSVNLVGTATVNLYVDSSAATTVNVTNAGIPTNGYWLLGWSQTDGFVNATESDFTTFATATAGTGSTLSGATSQTDYVNKAVNANQLWPLNDEGSTTYSGTYPIFGANADGSGTGASTANPCALVTASWAGSASTVTLGTMSSATISTTVPASGDSGGYGFSLTHAAYGTVAVTGLQIFATVNYTVAASASTSWTTMFTWGQAGVSPANPNISPTFTM